MSLRGIDNSSWNIQLVFNCWNIQHIISLDNNMAIVCWHYTLVKYNFNEFLMKGTKVIGNFHF